MGKWGNVSFVARETTTRGHPTAVWCAACDEEQKNTPFSHLSPRARRAGGVTSAAKALLLSKEALLGSLCCTRLEGWAPTPEPAECLEQNSRVLINGR